MHIGWPEVILALGIFMLLFGAKKIPDIARSLGKALREFKKGVREITEEVDEPKDDDAEG